MFTVVVRFNLINLHELINNCAVKKFVVCTNFLKALFLAFYIHFGVTAKTRLKRGWGYEPPQWGGGGGASVDPPPQEIHKEPVADVGAEPVRYNYAFGKPASGRPYYSNPRNYY